MMLSRRPRRDDAADARPGYASDFGSSHISLHSPFPAGPGKSKRVRAHHMTAGRDAVKSASARHFNAVARRQPDCALTADFLA